MRTRTCVALCLFVLMPLAGCEQLGFEDPAKVAAMKEAEGKAVGSACRQSGRAIEDCYAMNPKALKAAVFAGWREMDGYMRENKMEAVKPELVATQGKAKDANAEEAAPPAEADAEAKDKPAKGDKADKADKAEKSDKPAKTDKPAKAEKTAKH